MMENSTHSLTVNITKAVVLSIVCFKLAIGNVLLAETVPGIEGPPEIGAMDENGVNLVSGRLSVSKTDLSIGIGELSLTHTISSHSNMFLHFTDNFTGGLTRVTYGNGDIDYKVVFGNMSSTFRYYNNDYHDKNSSGATLEQLNTTEWRYVHPDGTEIYFDDDINFNWGYTTWLFGFSTTQTFALGVANRVVYPNGLEINVHFRQKDASDPDSISRIQSVTASNGLQLKYTYGSNSSSSNDFAWTHPTEITAINNAVEYCDPLADNCNVSDSWPSVNYSWPANLETNGGDFVITEPGGQQTTYKHGLYCKTGTGVSSCGNDNPLISQIIDSTSAGAVTRSYEYGNQYHCHSDGATWDCSILKQGLITKVTMGTAEWTYGYSVPQYDYIPFEAHSAGAKGTMKVTVDAGSGELTKITDSNVNKSYTLTSGGKIDTVDYGNVISGYYEQIKFGYDSIGNLTSRTQKADPAKPAANIVSSATYSNLCNSVKTQKKPDSFTDARLNITNYTYHCDSGKIAKVTLPAAEDGGIRPETRYTYKEITPRYLDSSGGVVASSPIWVIDEERYCISSVATDTSCSGTNDEVVKTYEYGDTTSATNLFLKGISIVAKGEISKTRRTCFTYDDVGNKLSETSPKSEISLTSCQ